MCQQSTSWSDDVRPASPREHGEMRSGSETASTPTSTVSDPHPSMIRQVYPQTPNGCEECLRLGTEWVHLRPCLTLRARRLPQLFSAPARPRGRATPSSGRSNRARAGADVMSTNSRSDSRELVETPDLN